VVEGFSDEVGRMWVAIMSELQNRKQACGISNPYFPISIP
jgi:hypothetical protein